MRGAPNHAGKADEDLPTAAAVGRHRQGARRVCQIAFAAAALRSPFAMQTANFASANCPEQTQHSNLLRPL